MVIITLNGIERIGKSYYSGILNKYLKTKYADMFQTRKFSFPSYTTTSGKKLAELIRRFREDDLLRFTSLTATRYRRIAGLFMENMMDYGPLVSLGANSPHNVSLVNNYGLYSITAHGLAAGMSYRLLLKAMERYRFSPPDLAFFLITKNVRKMLTEPLKTHEVYSSQNEEMDPETYSEDYINYFTMVNAYYRQVHLANALTYPKSKFILVEVDPNDNGHITKTVEKIKSVAESFFLNRRLRAGGPPPQSGASAS